MSSSHLKGGSEDDLQKFLAGVRVLRGNAGDNGTDETLDTAGLKQKYVAFFPTTAGQETLPGEHGKGLGRTVNRQFSIRYHDCHS